MIECFGARDPHWAHIRALHLLREPQCQWCGGIVCLEVHHIIPYHVDRALELVELNLITLCEAPGLECHLLRGHLGNWTRWNVNIRAEAEQQRLTWVRLTLR